jgi:hypothetical protein
MSDLLLKPGRGVGQSKDCQAEKGHTPWGGTGMWGMRDYKLWT